jgi:uncharacterized protein (TIGR00725 family)
MRRTVVGVMGPGGGGSALEDEAFLLGQLIARNGWILLTGGRRSGVMDAASRGAKSVAGSITVGILPTAHGSPDVSDAVDVAVFTNMGDARNAVNVQSSDVVVAFGADTAGTLSEIALALKSRKHVVLLGARDAPRAFLETCGGDRLHQAADPAGAIAALLALGLTPGPSWTPPTP